MYQTQSPLTVMVFKKLESLFKDISINFYNDGECDISFSTPILNFGFEYKNEDAEIEKSSLNIAIEVCFAPVEDGLQVSHRAFIYRPDTNELIEPSGFVKSKEYDYKEITSLILDDYNFNELQLVGAPKLTTQAKTFCSDGFKLKSASESIYEISEALREEIKSRILGLGTLINEMDTVEERKEYVLAEPNFDTPHIYILR